MTTAPPCIVVFVTAGSAVEAEHIAGTLVTERLAACVNLVGPVRSIYRWEGTIHRDEEHLLVIKTRADCFEALAARVRALHSYTTPEIVAVPLAAGSPAYLEWICSETASP